MANQETGKKTPRRRKRGKQRKEPMELPVLRPDAAGIDIGAEEIWVAVPVDRDREPVRRFGSFTTDLQELGTWLEKCGIKTVAMESTGVYWIPLFQLLEDRGLEVRLVNARNYRNVAGRPTDAGDCQWLQYLHSVGLVKGSFRPEQAICAVRTLWRHRDNLVKAATVLVLQMQKALDQMNIKLQYVLSEVTSVSGLAILDALVRGERNPSRLAELCHGRVKASRADIEKSLQGDYRPEHMVVLAQVLRLYRHQQEEITRLDGEIEKFLQELPAGGVAGPAEPEPPAKGPQRGRRGRAKKEGGHGNQPAFDLEGQCARIAGVNLTAIPGIGPLVAQTILAEVGPNLSAFPSEGDFCSWLCLCPHNQITGGKVVSSRTRKSGNRVATALRQAAQVLHHSPSALGDYLRKMKARLGKAEGITAAAHKLARLVYHLLTTKNPYDETIVARHQQLSDERKLVRLQRQARLRGFELVPLAEN